MMLGELEYEDIYYPERNTINLTITNNTVVGEIQDGVKAQYFPFTAHMVLLTFIIFVSIIVMNLLFGLAVSDVQVNYKRKKSQFISLNGMDSIKSTPHIKQ